jgi:transposase
MFYIGIDIAKRSHEISILDNLEGVLEPSMKVGNTVEGAQKLVTLFEKHKVLPENCIIGMESTGHYWLVFYSFLVGRGFTVKVINPIITDAYRNMLVRKVKNDSVDAQVIAKVLMLGEYKESPVANEEALALRQLCRFRSYEVDTCSDLKRKAIALLDQIFPEYTKMFSDVFGITSKEVLTNFTTPEELSQINTRKLSNLINKASKGRFGTEKALEMKAIASKSLGIRFATDAFAFQLRQIVEQLEFVESKVAELDEQIAEYMKRSDSYITTIPGIGPVLGAVIISEIADISRFSDAKKIVAYAGLDASVSQSGDFEGSNMHMSKRGSPYLRRAIFTAANVASWCDPELSSYYQRLKARGKHHYVAVGAVARKLCYIIFAVLTENRPFESR